ncbi:MAG: hypothetical protein LBT58_05390 [Endomicrobium sp.]|jgi:hypothetical protein|nr:hypothetical protein [Endomicrobium sp.]
MIYQNTNPNKTIQVHSPISLTSLGKDIKNKINGAGIFAKYKRKLCDFVEKTNIKNAYDIQTESFKVVKEHLLSMLDEKELIAIKDEAFYRGMIVEDVIAIFGVLLEKSI